jgi:hypothetical protein
MVPDTMVPDADPETMVPDTMVPDADPETMVPDADPDADNS